MTSGADSYALGLTGCDSRSPPALKQTLRQLGIRRPAAHQFAHIFETGGVPIYMTVRGYYEFWAEDRLRGGSVYLQAIIPLGGPKESWVRTL